ncbi:MAG: glycosyltransferase family 2 protein [Nanoarchaeota archaeon]|nr:glycosyltransferase family 2 protein [Nanoarchaeota archaeon]
MSEKSEFSSSILIGIPAYNEGPVIAQTISKIKEAGFLNIVVVDDCSTDNTAQIVEELGVDVISLPINRGAGGATSTLIEIAKRRNVEYLVLIDADLQHNPLEISKLLRFKEKSDVVIGSRMIGKHRTGMPFSRRVANSIGSIITWFFFGVFVYDSQSGFKVLNKKALHSIKITFDRFEFCSEILGECYRHNLSIKEVPIGVHYSKHSLEKEHGQNIFNGFKMIVRFMLK